LLALRNCLEAFPWSQVASSGGVTSAGSGAGGGEGDAVGLLRAWLARLLAALARASQLVLPYLAAQASCGCSVLGVLGGWAWLLGGCRARVS
jgi:hypothetical protein